MLELTMGKLVIVGDTPVFSIGPNCIFECEPSFLYKIYPIRILGSIIVNFSLHVNVLVSNLEEVFHIYIFFLCHIYIYL